MIGLHRENIFDKRKLGNCASISSELGKDSGVSLARLIVFFIAREIDVKLEKKSRSGFEPEWYCSAGNCVAAPPPRHCWVFIRPDTDFQFC